MRIEVACRKSGYKTVIPIRSFEDTLLKESYVYRPFYIKDERIVIFNPATNEVWIDDGSSDGVAFVVDGESAERITRFLE